MLKMSLNNCITSSSAQILSELNNLCLNQTENVTSLTTMAVSSNNSNWYYIFDYWRIEGDSRTRNFPLLKDGPVPVVLFMSIYFAFSTLIGPYIMSKRPAFVLRGPMLAYNTLMVIFNVYFFFKMISFSNYGRDFLDFRFPDKEDRSARTLALIDTTYLYFLTKFVDLLDTVFFVLRKKNNQISGLHLYHHTVVPIIAWLAMRMCPTVPSFRIFAIFNSLVHVVMYSYYALAAFGPSIQPYLWWKKYITQIQLFQFAIFIVYGIFLGRLQTGYPPNWFWIGFVQNPIFFFLFLNFYRGSYKKKKTTDVRKAQ